MYDRFYEFGLSDEVLNSLSNMGFEEPTQIQKIAIPPVMKGKDIIGVAQTGTGKIAVFGIPIVEKNTRGKSKRPCALVACAHARDCHTSGPGNEQDRQK